MESKHRQTFKMSSLVEPNNFFQVKKEDYALVIAKYNMTDKMVKESIENIHQWYKMQPHLPEGVLSDPFRLLLATGFSLEKTKRKIDNLFLARNMFHEILGDRDPWSEQLKSVKKYGQGLILPRRLDDMSRVFVCVFLSADFIDYNLKNVFKLLLMVYDYKLLSDVALGDHYILDCKDIKLGHITQVTPTIIKQVLFILQSCYGSKINGIHFLNVPAYAEFLITLISSSLNKKIASRVHVHRNNKSLHKLISKGILPSDLGGDDKSYTELADELYEQLDRPDIREWFLKQNQFQSDESKRIGVNGDMSNDLLGLQGSFRALDID